MKSRISNILPCALATMLLVGGWRYLEARPDFDVHPRNIENAIGENVRLDTLRIDNAGDELLTWGLVVEADVEGWLSASPDTGATPVNRASFIVIRQDLRQFDAGHYYGNIHFISNDSTRATYDVPIADHTTQYPRIETTWAIPQQGEWWGMDMDRIIGDMEWGRTYSFNMNVRNRGSAQLDCDTIACDNGYFTISPGRFSLDAGANRNVTVTFVADELGGNAGTIRSISNAWDPRELNFRITATVLPVFRMGGMIPDTTIDEDAPELLIADLDTVFIASDAGTEITVTPTSGITTRLARNKELFIRSRPNWNGNVAVYLRAALEDSVLADTFLVRVNPTPDAPDPFDLISPPYDDTLYYDGGDSLFVWQSTTDPDLDTVVYHIEVYREGDYEAPVLMADNLTDTTLNLGSIYRNPDLSGRFEWTVTAEGGMRVRPAWSTFYFTLTAARLGVAIDLKPPETKDLIEIYPSPFNASLTVLVRPKSYGNCRLELICLDGRSSGIYLDRVVAPGEYKVSINTGNFASGSYFLSATIDGVSFLKPVRYVR